MTVWVRFRNDVGEEHVVLGRGETQDHAVADALDALERVQGAGPPPYEWYVVEVNSA